MALGALLQSFFVVCLLLGSGSTAKQEMSVYVSKPSDQYGFPYFHFFTGMFYGFILGALVVGYLVYKFILSPRRPSTPCKAKPKISRDPQSSTGSKDFKSSSPGRSPKIHRDPGLRPTKANVLVQGPVNYQHSPHYKKEKYQILGDHHWGAWHY